MPAQPPGPLATTFHYRDGLIKRITVPVNLSMMQAFVFNLREEIPQHLREALSLTFDFWLNTNIFYNTYARGELLQNSEMSHREPLRLNGVARIARDELRHLIRSGFRSTPIEHPVELREWQG